MLNTQLISDLNQEFNRGVGWEINDIYYYFRDSNHPPSNYYYLPDGQTGQFTPLPFQTKQYVREVFSYFEKIFALRYIESNTQSGNIALGSHNMMVGAYASYPFVNSSELEIEASSNNGYPGQFVYGAINHEMGHALGLPHPVNGSPGGHATAMWYTPTQGIEQISLGMHDILVLQAKYGAVIDTTNNIYFLQTKSAGSVTKVFEGNNIYLTGDFCLWDGGGVNTLDFSKNAGSCFVDMRPGEFSTISNVSMTSPKNDTPHFSIAFNSRFQNFVGSNFNDVIIGNDFFNQIKAGSGDDHIDGGIGTDTAIYSGQRANYIINKISGGYTISDNAGGDGTDTLINIEIIQFVDVAFSLVSGADTTAPSVMTFTPADEAVDISLVSDIVLAFNELIVRGAGNIILKNNTGNVVEIFNAATSNKLSIAGSTLTINPSSDFSGSSEYTVELESGSVRDIAGNNYVGTTSYNFTTVSSLRTLTGTAGNDNLTGTSFSERIDGLDGNDSITGGGGADTLIGGAGEDTLYSSSSNEIIDGGIGFDIVSYVNSNTSVYVNLTDGVTSGGGGFDLISNIEDVNGSNYNDTLIGSSRDDMFAALDGDDNIEGRGGNDYFFGHSLGNDSIDGGAGIDYVEYYYTNSSVYVNLALNTAMHGGYTDRLINVETIGGSQSYGDSLIGSNGNETFYGWGGNDFFSSGFGNDTIHGGPGNDTIDGDAGIDTAIFNGNLANYTLTKSGSTYTVRAKTGTDGTDTLTNVESLKFTDLTVNLQVTGIAAAAPLTDVQRISELYVAFFNRTPDADGLAYWIGQKVAGQSINQISEAFYNVGASSTYSGLTGFSTSMSNEDFLHVFYKNVLGRPDGADTGGLAYWNGKLANGSSTRSSLANDILDSAHTFKGNPTWGWVADLLDNKIAVANTIAVEWGLTYNTDAYARGVAIAAAITPTDTAAAISLIGVTGSDLHLG